MIIIERADNTAAIITQSAANKLPERPVNTSFDARRVNLHADFSVFSTPEWKCVRIFKNTAFSLIYAYTCIQMARLARNWTLLFHARGLFSK